MEAVRKYVTVTLPRYLKDLPLPKDVQACACHGPLLRHGSFAPLPLLCAKGEGIGARLDLPCFGLLYLRDPPSSESGSLDLSLCRNCSAPATASQA